MKTSSLEFDMLLTKLTKAVITKNKMRILNAYEEAKDFDLEKVNDRLYKQYEKLVEKGNEILGY